MGVSGKLFQLTVVAGLVGLSVAGTGAQRRDALPGKPDDKTVVHVLNRLGFGPAPGDVERVRKMGLAAYIEQQLHPERIADEALAQRLQGFETLTMSSREMAEEIFLPADMQRREAQRAGTPPAGTPPARPQQPAPMQGERRVIAELNQQKLIRAVYSEKQLNEVMVDFWFNHFNVFAGKGQTRTYVTEYERDTIRPRVFGRFRDLLGAVAESPAMLFYLDNWQSAAAEDAATMAAPQRGRPGQRARGRRATEMMQQAPPQQRRRGLNENYARELMELHTLGVDGGYTQKDVQEVARAFTGWTIQQPRQGGSFHFEPRIHDNGEKVALGMKIAAGGGKKDGERILDLLAKHPATAKFIATKLARRFVSDDPPQALVQRAADRFLATDGDIREVVKTIITSPEFFGQAVAACEGEVSVRVRGQRRARHRIRDLQCPATRADVTGAGDAALHVPAADRLRRSRGRVGEYRRAVEPHELRRAACQRPHARLDAVRQSHGGHDRVDARWQVMSRRPRARRSPRRRQRRSRSR